MDEVIISPFIFEDLVISVKILFLSLFIAQHRIQSSKEGPMKCPYCGYSDDRVLDTREQKDGDLIRRRRECLSCKSRFTTVESLVLNYPFVVKKDGRTEPFSRDKIFKGIQAACQKRPVSLQQVETLVNSLCSWVMARGDKEISSQLVGRKVMQEMRNLDHVAYVRFASVYRTFKDVQEFVESLEEEGESPSNNRVKSPDIIGDEGTEHGNF